MTPRDVLANPHAPPSAVWAALGSLLGPGIGVWEAETLQTEVERLGRIVFGDSFAVEVDSDLRICSRTVAGTTVPYESLSGGAKEQLGIVARLAGAALVAKEDSVPVIIDDALGFTDAGRLARMGEVFDAVGGDGQVIVLTCSPERYAGVGDATRIELTA